MTNNYGGINSRNSAEGKAALIYLVLFYAGGWGISFFIFENDTLNVIGGIIGLIIGIVYLVYQKNLEIH